MGRGLVAFSGCLGQSASTHNRHAMECSKETRAVRRAFHPFEERADGPQGAGSDGAQHPAEWRASPPFGSERARLRARQRGLQLLRRGWFSDPGSEASEDDQAENVSNEA